MKTRNSNIVRCWNIKKKNYSKICYEISFTTFFFIFVLVWNIIFSYAAIKRHEVYAPHIAEYTHRDMKKRNHLNLFIHFLFLFCVGWFDLKNSVVRCSETWNIYFLFLFILLKFLCVGMELFFFFFFSVTAVDFVIFLGISNITTYIHVHVYMYILNLECCRCSLIVVAAVTIQWCGYYGIVVVHTYCYYYYYS